MGKFISVRISSCRITSVSFDQEVPNMVNHQEVKTKQTKKKKTQYKYEKKEKPRSSMPGFLLVYFIFILETDFWQSSCLALPGAGSSVLYHRDSPPPLSPQ